MRVLRISISHIQVCASLALSVFFGLALASTNVWASVNIGQAMTLGPSAQSHSIFAARYNPANASLLIHEEEKFRLNYLPGVALATELGDVNNFEAELDELIDILDDPTQAEDVNETLARFNGLLAEMGEEGYLKADVHLTAPALPLYWRPGIFKGTLFVELESLTQIRTSVLDAPLSFDDQNQSFATATSGYIKSGIQKHLAVGYSYDILGEGQTKPWGGRLFAGVKLTVFNLELSKQVIRLQQLDGKDIGDVIEDEYETNLKSTTNVGLDLGVTWLTDKYNVGFTLKNINSPKFDYGSVGLNCDTLPDASLQRNNCEAAQFFSSEITLEESHTKHATATIDGTYFLSSRWTVSGALDLAQYDDIVAMENQWLNVSTAYYPQKSYWPSWRVGFRKNLVGSQLSNVSVGFSLFQRLSVDAFVALDDVTIDGNTGPRSSGFSLSFEEKF